MPRKRQDTGTEYLLKTRPSRKKLAEFKAYLTQHGPATARQIHFATGLSMDSVRHCVHHSRWLVAVEYRYEKSRVQERLVPVYAHEGKHIGGVCDCGRKLFNPPIVAYKKGRTNQPSKVCNYCRSLLMDNEIITYEPTPEEIAAACREIQAEWSPALRRAREATFTYQKVETPRLKHPKIPRGIQ